MMNQIKNFQYPSPPPPHPCLEVHNSINYRGGVRRTLVLTPHPYYQKKVNPSLERFLYTPLIYFNDSSFKTNKKTGK